MARDDWRIRIELPEDDAGGLLDRLGLHLSAPARELAKELEGRRLAVSQADDHVFVYASSRREAERAREIVEAELEELGISAHASRVEHWLAAEDRWEAAKPLVGDSGPGETAGGNREVPPEPERSIEEEVLAEGYAPWEVRIECESHDEARELADRLEAEGYGVVRRYRYVIAGTATREEAARLARGLHGEVEPGGELVWEVMRQNPFAVFGGGMGGSGTPL
jgi:hypothetical protein